MMDPEATVTGTWTGLAPERGIEYLVRRYTDRSMTVATRPSHSADQWGPEVGLRAAGERVAEAGRCTCGFVGCSDAGWRS